MKVKRVKSSCSDIAIESVSDSKRNKKMLENKLSRKTKDTSTVLITSSCKKRRPGQGLKNSCGVKIHSPASIIRDECTDLRLAFSRIDEASKTSEGVSTALDTIFSPAFHLFKGEPSNSCTSSVEQAENSDEKFEEVQTRVKTIASSSSKTSLVKDASKAFISCSFPSHVTAFSMDAMQSDSCVHCIDGDENRDPLDGIEDTKEDGPEMTPLSLAVHKSVTLSRNQESKHLDAHVDEDDLDDFDPYLFIKYLPNLLEVVPANRSTVLLPKQTRRCPPITLVLDLDETLVHSTLEHCEDADFTFPVTFSSQEYTVYVRRRPHLQMFMEKVAQMFEIIVFTASQSIYAEQLLNILDPKRNLIRHRVFQDSCVFVEGNYLKDLTVLGRDLAKVAIVDNSPQAFGFQVDNGIPIESWFDDRSDSALAMLLPFLETLVGVDDVRPLIANKFKLRQKVAAAFDPW